MLIVTLVAAATIMSLRSGDFAAGGTIPSALMSADCGGQNRPPALVWKNAPASTKSFVLTERDPDAPVAGGFYHWVVYDLPADTRSLSRAPSGSDRLGRASTGKPEYYGPCPPPGPAHRYIFTLYALDVTNLDGGAPLTGPQLESRMRGHVIARATLEATAARP